MEQLYSLFLQHPVICTDSRNCSKGSIFFALRGENFNANAFAYKALENGCSYAIVDEKEFALDSRYILVDDVLTTLQQLATYHRKKLGTTIIGITGTNGKTTTKELIASVLEEKFNVLYTQGNLNNHIGVPLTLLQLNAEHEIAVVEMGANHQGEIGILCNIAFPDFGIITNVGKAHLEGFGSFEGIKKTKAELYHHIFAHGQKIFINHSNPHLLEMASLAGFKSKDRIYEYSLSAGMQEIDVFGETVSCSPFLKMSCLLQLKHKLEINTKLIGIYNAENVLAAVAIGNYFGVDTIAIKRGLEKYEPNNNRSQLTVTANNKLVVDAYNANPTSMKAAIINFAQMQVENKALILGDMLELGEQSAEEHQQIINLLQSNQLKEVILIGNEFGKTENSYLCFQRVEEVIKHLNKYPFHDYYILIKGSRGIRLEKVIEKL